MESLCSLEFKAPKTEGAAMSHSSICVFAMSSGDVLASCDKLYWCGNRLTD